MPIAVLKSVLAVVSSVSPSSEQGGNYGLGESLYIGRGCTDLWGNMFQVKGHGYWSPSEKKFKLLRRRANARNVSQHTLWGVQHIHINLTLIHCMLSFANFSPRYIPGLIIYVGSPWFSRWSYNKLQSHFWRVPKVTELINYLKAARCSVIKANEGTK